MACLDIGVFEKKGVAVLACYGGTFDPVEHINPLMVLEGGKVSHAVACCLDMSWPRQYLEGRGWS